MIYITKEQFKHDFIRGKGSALMELKTSDNPQKYHDIVHYGCLHNTTYDMQCEGDRGWYLYQAALCVGATSIENVVIDRYSRSFWDSNLFVQLTSMLYHFAADGSIAARTALYDKYSALMDKLSSSNVVINSICRERDMFDWLCVWLTSLDGWSSFKRVVQEVSERLIVKDADFYFSQWFYDNSKNKFGNKRVELYLSKQAEREKTIRNYWINAQNWDHPKLEKRLDPTFDEVIETASGKRFSGRMCSTRFVRKATPDELDRLFLAAMEEQDLQKRAEILWGFRRVKYPIPENILTDLLQSENVDIRDTAFYFLKNNSSPKVREYALSLLEKGEDVMNAIGLLSKNMTKEDEAVLSCSVKSIPVKFHEYDWHSAFMSAVDGMRSLKGKPQTDLLQYMYHQTFCGNCRESIVRLMRNKKVLTEEIQNECLYDSNSEIRDFVKKFS